MEKRALDISDMTRRNIVQRSIAVTGVPRGGTTLLGCLINSLNNSYCISEPMAIEEQLHQSATPEEFLEHVRSYFEEQREHILTTGRALNRIGKDGRPVTNYFRRVGNRIIEPDYLEAEEAVNVCDGQFLLAVKHNAHFLSILPLLCDTPDISVIGILRHPIPTILSWRSLDLPISHGRLPSGEKFWAELSEIAWSGRDLLLKQVMIYEIIAARLMAFRQEILLVCYESLVREPGQLCTLLNQKFRGSVIFESRNRNKDYNWGEVRQLKAMLRANAPNTLKLYPDLDDLESPMVCEIEER